MRAIYTNENGVIYLSDKDFRDGNHAMGYYGDKFKFIGFITDRMLIEEDKRDYQKEFLRYKDYVSQ